MKVVNYSKFRQQLKDYCDQVTDQGEDVYITRKNDKDVVLISVEKYERLTRSKYDFSNSAESKVAESIIVDNYQANSEDDLMTWRFRKGVELDIAQKKIMGHPVAGYDREKKKAFLEYPDGRREYIDEIKISVGIE